MGIKTNNPGLFRQFRSFIERDQTAETLEPTNEWELLRYRRAEWTGGKPEGTYEYGIVYRNKRGQEHYTGCAERDFNDWRDS